MFETLSALARAFSYAKARALLVSHLACKFGRRGEVDNKGRRRAEGLAKLGGERVLYGRFNVDRVSPSLFMPNEGRVSSAADAFARDYFARLHPYFVDRGLNDYDLRRLESCAMVVGPMLISSGLPLSHLSALEIGCGKGLKAFPVASLFKRYVGVDLDRDAIESAARTAADLEIGNLHFSCSNATEIIANPERYGSGFDIVFLHAVMEHLTLEERVAIFELIRSVRSVGGAVMLLETPNRLFPFDHHSSELHFVDALPDSVALRYIRKKSKRKAAQDFVSEDLRPSGDGSAILLSEPDPIARLYRLGRGLSYHDFELDYYDDSNCFAPAMDGYHPLLLNHQPLTRCELHVNDYCRDNNMPVHRAFSRAWIDFFDIPSVAHKCAHRATYLRPFYNGACEVTLRREFWSLDNFHCKAGGSLVFDIKDRVNAGDHFVLLLERLGDGEAAIVRVDGEPVAEFSLDDLAITSAPYGDVWREWFLSSWVGMVVVAPVVIGAAQLWRNPPPRKEWIEGVGALALLALVSFHAITHPTGSWLSFDSDAVVLPLLLWLIARCQPAFGIAGAFVASTAIISATTFGIGHFGDAAVPVSHRVAGAQLVMMTVTLFTLVLSVLFAQRKEAEERLAKERAMLARLHAVGSRLWLKRDLPKALDEILATQETSGSMAEFVAALDGRIKSMAITHELLSSRHWQGIPLAELVRREMAPTPLLAIRGSMGRMSC